MDDSRCVWNAAKDSENERKHGITFEDACRVFDDPHHAVVPDDREYDEERWIATGRVDAGVLIVVFTDRDGKDRIIAARRAKRQEEETYYAAAFGFRGRSRR